MLSKLIPHIDESLKELGYFQTLYGLAETVVKPGDPELSFPGFYVGGTDYKPVELEQISGYHRLFSEMTTADLDQGITGCQTNMEIIYPMVFIGCLSRGKFKECNQYIDDSIANSVAYKIEQVDFKSIKSQIKAYSAKPYIRSVNTNRNQVWDQEFNGAENKLQFDKMLFSIRYDIRIRTNSGCLDIFNC